MKQAQYSGLITTMAITYQRNNRKLHQN
uniref:Uncharacterized protein n=1 Tax=Rhizophora mucronata TaxID=61149 RepID=A0A2P2NTA1_RHIMU